MRNTRPLVRRPFIRRFAVLAAASTASLMALVPDARPLEAAAPADASLRWLEAELAANQFTLPFPPTPGVATAVDWGLTIDAILALDAAGRGDDVAAATATGLLEDHLDDYITGESFGDSGSHYAGPIGKTLVLAQALQVDVNNFGGSDLEALSRAAVTASGLHVGRFSDVSMFGNYSNGFGQALNVIGLAATPTGAPPEAVAFLLDQQCPNGGFRLFYDAFPVENSTAGCDDDAEADFDVSGLTLNALAALPATPEVDAAIDAATAWLVASQDLEGGWSGTGPTDVVNSGTTAVVVQGLVAVGGDDEAVSRGADYLARQQLLVAETAGTPVAAESGAIAYNAQAHDEALVSGITFGGRDQWRRSTAQAVRALRGVERPSSAPVTVAPSRILDTRVGGQTVDGLQAGGGAIAAGTTLELDVSGRAGVPDDASGVVLNVTAVGGAGPGFVTVHPCIDNSPLSSNLNFLAGGVVANTVVSALSGSGSVCVKVGGSAVDLIADVSGFFAGPGTFPLMPPARLLDTRPGEETIDGQQTGAGVAAAGTTVRLPVADRGNVPTNVDAVVLNVTAIGTGGGGFVTIHPCLADPPLASNLNFLGTGVSSASVITRFSSDGDVCLTVGGSGAHLIVDVNGWFVPGSAYGPLAPARLIDTRPDQTTIDGAEIGAGEVAGGSTVKVPVAGRAGVPITARSAVLNVTIVSDGTGGSFATVHPCLGTPPLASNVNLVGAGVAANAAVAELTSDGSVCITVGGDPLHVIVDVSGYFG
jgi:hypothetical protein